MTDEIWVVRGRRPVLWTAPYRVRWMDQSCCDLLRVLPPMLAHQERAFSDFFAEHNGCRLTRQQLKAVADPLPLGLPAEESFSWERPRLSQLTKYRPEKRIERDAFLDAVYQRGLGGSRDEVEYWFNQFCNAMFDWLINRERPVDLYFLKLHPTPLRENWAKRILGASKQRRFKGIDGLIQNGSLFAMDGEVFRRRVEVEHTKVWVKTTRGVEKTRLLRLGRAGYARSIIQSGVRQAETVKRIYRQWKDDFGAPSALFLPGTLEGAGGVVQNIRGRKLGRQRIKLRRLARALAFKPRPRPKNSARWKKPVVPKVRVVQPAPPDVWDGRGYVPPPEHRKDRLAGVLVLLAAQKRYVDELLAVRPDGRPEGLAERVEQLA